MRLTFNEVLQWTGTTCLLTMYVLMSFFSDLRPWDIVAGLAGGTCYLIWTLRVGNRPQMTINIAAIAINVAGLIRAWG